ncbi:MAG TPA: SEC-C metal-binding domain-containing protein [Vicinamibacterales bacterium]|nr:SEC-C metal-binding domain-containing protein [Vicinamibacterales bacterium]
MAGPTGRLAPGRNDPCPCGSGRKYKQCHQASAGKMTPKSKALLALLVAVSAMGLYSAFSSASDQADQPGRVWSAEHGHWH